MSAMNFAVPRWNRKLLYLSTKMAFLGLLRCEHDNSSTIWSSFTTKFCGDVSWVMRRQLVFEKTKKKHRSAVFLGSQNGDYVVKRFGSRSTPEKRKNSQEIKNLVHRNFCNDPYHIFAKFQGLTPNTCVNVCAVSYTHLTLPTICSV